MLKRRLSLFLVVALLVGMIALTAHAMDFTLAFNFVNDTDTSGSTRRSGNGGYAFAQVNTISGVNRATLWVYNATTQSSTTGNSVSSTGPHNLGYNDPGYCTLYGRATSGYGYMTGTWNP